MDSRTKLLAVVGAGLAVATLGGPLWGHTDDPKGPDFEPVYRGPGYRKAAGANNPGDPAENVELLSWITVPEFETGAGGANDCWGYTSPSGREYAILCLSNATGFVDITDPEDPAIVGTVSATGCTWHDAKVFVDHAYVVSECGNEGIQVIDLSDIDKGVVTHVRNVSTGGPASHNVALNPESGYLYRTGGSGNGLLIYDLNADRSNPQMVAEWTDRYVHDAQITTMESGPWAGREVAFCNSGFNGGGTETGLDILDVTDKDNIIELARYEYPQAAYSHQGWLSADQTIYYVNDEADEREFNVNTTTHLIDVSDLEAPFEVKTFSSGVASIDHNLYVRGNLIFEANYRSGLRVFDASDPLNPVEHGFYDTYPANDNPRFNGLWSNFPFFESGVVIGSDTSRGLFVWRVTGLETPGDVDGDGDVDFNDILQLLAAWGPCDEDCPEDLDDDNDVDFNDLLVLLANWTG